MIVAWWGRYSRECKMISAGERERKVADRMSLSRQHRMGKAGFARAQSSAMVPREEGMHWAQVQGRHTMWWCQLLRALGAQRGNAESLQMPLELQISQKQYCCSDRPLHPRARNLAALGSFWPWSPWGQGYVAIWSPCPLHNLPPLPILPPAHPPGIEMPEFSSPEQAIFWSLYMPLPLCPAERRADVSHPPSSSGCAPLGLQGGPWVAGGQWGGKKLRQESQGVHTHMCHPLELQRRATEPPFEHFTQGGSAERTRCLFLTQDTVTTSGFSHPWEQKELSYTSYNKASPWSSRRPCYF